MLKAYLLYDYQNSLTAKFDIKTDRLQRGTNLGLRCLTAKPKWPCSSGEACKCWFSTEVGCAGSIFSTSGASGHSVTRARRTLLTTAPPAWHREHRNWRRMNRSCQTLAQSPAELVQPCCVSSLWLFCLAGLKPRMSPCNHCPRLLTKLLHQCAAIC